MLMLNNDKQLERGLFRSKNQGILVLGCEVGQGLSHSFVKGANQSRVIEHTVSF